MARVLIAVQDIPDKSPLVMFSDIACVVWYQQSQRFVTVCAQSAIRISRPAFDLDLDFMVLQTCTYLLSGSVFFRQLATCTNPDGGRQGSAYTAKDILSMDCASVHDNDSSRQRVCLAGLPIL
jgi:hypothetical protein